MVHYTNASVILREDFRDTEDLGGCLLRLGCEEERIRPETLALRRRAERPDEHARATSPAAGGHGKDRGGEAGNAHQISHDETLQHPRCVFQVLKQHFARYTPEMVEQYCGIPQGRLSQGRGDFAPARPGPKRPAAICYAVGWTQHSTGVQIIRTAAILQLLLGNIGRPGGGILALRGHASIQGSTDIPTLYDILPGYMPMPFLDEEYETSRNTSKKHTAANRLWHNFDKYFDQPDARLLRRCMPPRKRMGIPLAAARHRRSLGIMGYWLDMADGKMDGLFRYGPKSRGRRAKCRLQRKAMPKLKWLVVRDMVETETASFWYDSPEVERGEARSRKTSTRKSS